MKKGTILGLLVGLLVVGIAYVSMSVSYKNEEAELRTAIEKKQKMNGAAFDNMWKIISQQASVSDEYQKNFRDIYKDIMDSRYQNDANSGGTASNMTNIDQNSMLFNFVKEHNPELSTDLYNKLSNSISAERSNWYQRQLELSALSQEHTTLLRKFPGKWFLSDFKEIEITIVTSSKTEEVMRTGKEDDVKLF